MFVYNPCIDLAMSKAYKRKFTPLYHVGMFFIWKKGKEIIWQKYLPTARKKILKFEFGSHFDRLCGIRVTCIALVTVRWWYTCSQQSTFMFLLWDFLFNLNDSCSWIIKKSPLFWWKMLFQILFLKAKRDKSLSNCNYQPNMLHTRPS